MEFKNILVPHDCEFTSDKALDNAIKIAKLVQDSKITLLHVLQELALPASLALTAKPLYSFRTGERITSKAFIKEIHHELKQKFLKELENRKQKCDDFGISSQIKIDMGDPAEKILEYANENKFDLIVIFLIRNIQLQYQSINWIILRLCKYF